MKDHGTATWFHAATASECLKSIEAAVRTSLPAISRRLDVRTALAAALALVALLAGVAWASYGAGIRAGVTTDARLAAMLHDRPADAAALVRLMEANPAFAREIEEAPRFTDQAAGREAASVTVWVK